MKVLYEGLLVIIRTFDSDYTVAVQYYTVFLQLLAVFGYIT